MIDLVFQNKTQDAQWEADFFEKIIEAGIATLALELPLYGLSVNLVDEAEMQKLNREHRGKDTPTDVLSFPMKIEAGPLRHSSSEASDLGDIFICLSIAKKEAKEENIPVASKLAWLTIHGFLHLCGYDHEISQRQAEGMLGLENKILSQVDIS